MPAMQRPQPDAPMATRPPVAPRPRRHGAGAVASDAFQSAFFRARMGHGGHLYPPRPPYKELPPLGPRQVLHLWRNHDPAVSPQAKAKLAGAAVLGIASVPLLPFLAVPGVVAAWGAVKLGSMAHRDIKWRLWERTHELHPHHLPGGGGPGGHRGHGPYAAPQLAARVPAPHAMHAAHALNAPQAFAPQAFAQPALAPAPPAHVQGSNPLAATATWLKVPHTYTGELGGATHQRVLAANAAQAPHGTMSRSAPPGGPGPR